MNNRKKITSLMGCSIRDIRHDERGFLVKLHSKTARRSFWIGLDFDGVWDENGEAFENSADYVPAALRSEYGISSALSAYVPHVREKV